MSVATIVLGVCVVSTVLLMASAIRMLSLSERVALRWSHVGTRLFSVALLGILFLLVTPSVQTMLVGFGVALPSAGRPGFKLSEWARAYILAFVLIGIASVVLEMFFVEKCLRRDNHEEFARLCSFLVTCLLLMTLFVGEVGLAISLKKLANDFSRSSDWWTAAPPSQSR